MPCQICGLDIINMHFHHIIPRTKGGLDISSNLIELCCFCHFEIHSSAQNLKKRNFTEYLKWEKLSKNYKKIYLFKDIVKGNQKPYVKV